MGLLERGAAFVVARHLEVSLCVCGTFAAVWYSYCFHECFAFSAPGAVQKLRVDSVIHIQAQYWIIKNWECGLHRSCGSMVVHCNRRWRGVVRAFPRISEGAPWPLMRSQKTTPMHKMIYEIQDIACAPIMSWT